MNFKNNYKAVTIFTLSLVAGTLLLTRCTKSEGGEAAAAAPAQQFPVLVLAQKQATTYQEFSTTIEGIQDIEIRPQVSGYIDRILVDEGAYVQKGQTLFIINDRIYREAHNTANARLATAKANLATAELNVEKIKPLVSNNVVSDVQLKEAEAARDAAQASVNEALALVQSASINVGYTSVKAPADGYLGKIPFKTGSLVSMSTVEPLTVLSAVKAVYAYFSFSEVDFLNFTKNIPGKTLEEKLRQIPPVALALADNSIYPHTGKVEIVSGQFNDQTGAIAFRAIFPNADGLLRSGLTGKIRIPRVVDGAVIVPQESTFELQDKVFVLAVDAKNMVTSTPIGVADRFENFYLVSTGVKSGDRIVYAGLDKLRDGTVIDPQPVSLDSLQKGK
ncbi:efflux RND transporter periplasmic adaptor subunit [Pseudochryseolinea flava]|uniref:Efflux transporter periplasmic adaptor subunit n=1 Tax=Pseudochryseolinea flava TaxID=2059302 RepID=A0A364Y1D7_9BACT|nr:efflux RND transporter periplasmic adaptor subunit [Pseudochryseolinea flava]RAW00438.1 efflux transporter periplasmic adaptor subunit [Pseudochryseolinea flava]